MVIYYKESGHKSYGKYFDEESDFGSDIDSDILFI